MPKTTFLNYSAEVLNKKQVVPLLKRGKEKSKQSKQINLTGSGLSFSYLAISETQLLFTWPNHRQIVKTFNKNENKKTTTVLTQMQHSRRERKQKSNLFTQLSLLEYVWPQLY